MRRGCSLISEYCKVRCSPPCVRWTSLCLFHRFFWKNCVQTNRVLEVALACSFLAGKVEECREDVHDILCTYHDLMSSEGSPTASAELEQFSRSSPTYKRWKSRMIELEGKMLTDFGFALYSIGENRPHKHLLNLCRVYKCSRGVLNAAWGFLNDSCTIDLCCRYPPELISLSCLYLACIVLPPEHSLHDGWHEALFEGSPALPAGLNASYTDRTNLQALSDCSNSILHLYSSA